MAWEKLKKALLEETSTLINRRADESHRSGLHRLSELFLTRFAPEDLRGRSAADIYGMLYGLLRFIETWPGDKPRVRFLNPDVGGHGWESNATVLVVLCPGHAVLHGFGPR